MIRLTTHDEALAWNRIEIMLIVMSAVILVAIGELLLFPSPKWIATVLSGLSAGILILKCWADIIILSKPGKNCWAFEREE